MLQEDSTLREGPLEISGALLGDGKAFAGPIRFGLSFPTMSTTK